MKNFIMLVLYVLFSSMGLILMKLGIGKGFSLGLEDGGLYFHIGLAALVGIVLYVCSFFLSLLVMSKMDLTYFYPISAGLIYVIVCLLGAVFLKENISARECVGMALILGGVVVMNIGK